jgi:hypothetical protein
MDKFIATVTGPFGNINSTDAAKEKVESDRLTYVSGTQTPMDLLSPDTFVQNGAEFIKNTNQLIEYFFTPDIHKIKPILEQGLLVFADLEEYGWSISYKIQTQADLETQLQTTRYQSFISNAESAFNLNINDMITNLPLTDAIDTVRYYTDNNSLFVKYNEIIEQYHSDGTIGSLTGYFPNWYRYSELIKASSVRFVQPGFFELADEENQLWYSEFTNPNSELGLTFAYDLVDPAITVDDAYFKEFIDQISDILITGQTTLMGAYPTHAIPLDHRLRDSQGYYFKFISLDYIEKSLFVETQMAYLRNAVQPFFDDEQISTLLEYARTKWA